MPIKYEPLHSASHIRLLHLWSGSSQDPIQCSLSVVSFNTADEGDSPPYYDALSYVWGSGPAQREIFVDGWPCLVRENLWLFLRQWRQNNNTATMKPTPLWIDACCINQEDMVERSEQVQVMGDIYRSAARVLVWLGPGSRANGLVMDLLELVATHAQDVSTAIKQMFESQRHLPVALEKWCAHPYWSRTWVIQEILLAKKAILICGRRQLNTQRALETLKHVRWLSKEVPAATRATIQASPAGLLLDQVDKSLCNDDHYTPAPLASLILANRHSKCADPRDHVYALLSLASDCCVGHTIKVDYTAPIEVFFCQIIAFCAPSTPDILPFATTLAQIVNLNAATRHPGVSDTETASWTKSRSSDPFFTRVHDTFIFSQVFSTGYIISCVGQDEIRQLDGISSQGQVDGETGVETGVENVLNEILNSWTTRLPGFLAQSQRSLAKLLTTVLDEEGYDESNQDIRRLKAGFAQLPRIITSPVDSRPKAQTSNRRPASTSEPILSLQSPAASSTSLGGKTPTLSLVLAYFSAHKTKHFSVGLIYGLTDKGDRILQVPGYDLAFTRPRSAQAPLTGKAVFFTGPDRNRPLQPLQPPPPTRTHSTTAPATSVASSTAAMSPTSESKRSSPSWNYETIRSEADLSPSCRPMRLTCTPKEVLALSRY